MSVHDWTRVEAGIFHAFHNSWVTRLQDTLNEGRLPEGYYALNEQHFGRPIADVLTLHASPAADESSIPLPPASGGTAVAEVPPRVRHRKTLEPAGLARRRSLAIRLVALLEIISPAYKDRASRVEEFAAKAVGALDNGVHLLLIDLFPPGRSDPGGMYGAVCQRLEPTEESYDVPANEPLALASFAAGPRIEIYMERLAVGAALPDMPLFLGPDRYIEVPLEATYAVAYRGMPAFWRDVLEAKPPLRS
jgi:Protein of unknown function (DUF4058)